MANLSNSGSLVNYLDSNSVQGIPKVGDGATLLGYSDRSPATVVKVWSSGKSVYAQTQDDDYQRIDTNGFSESQVYIYSPDPEGYINTFKRDPKGAWVSVRKNPETGRWSKVRSSGVIFGERERYYDFTR